MNDRSTPVTLRPLLLSRRAVLLSAVALASLAMPMRARAATAPKRFGAQTHYGQAGWGSQVVEKLRAYGIGLNRVRDELYWSVLETVPGTYNWNDYGDVVMDRLAAGATPVILSFDFGNPLYNSPGKSFPDTRAAREAFANYVFAVLDRYARPGSGRHPGMIEAIEVWNEANAHWSGGYTAKQVAPLLAELTKAVAARVRADPAFDTVPVLGCAPVKVPLNFIKWCFDAGIGPAVDKVVVHPYGSAESMLTSVASLRAQLDASGHDQAIWATEFGNTTKPDDLIKLLAAAAASPIEVANYYLSKSSSGFSSGLVNGQDQITPVGRAWAAWAGWLDDARFVRREPLQGKTYALTFTLRDGRPLSVCWSHWGTTRLLAAGNHQVFNSLGAPVAKAASYDLAQAPLIFIGNAAFTEDLAGQRPVAEAFDGFSDRQRANGWSYRYRDGTQEGEMVRKMDNQYGPYWGVEGAQFASVFADGAHPDMRGGKPVDAIRRWTVTDGLSRLRIFGSISRAGQGDGVDIRILRNGSILYSVDGLSATIEFDLEIPAASGDSIDFSTSPGKEQSFDSTQWRIGVYGLD